LLFALSEGTSDIGIGIGIGMRVDTPSQPLRAGMKMKALALDFGRRTLIRTPIPETLNYKKSCS